MNNNTKLFGVLVAALFAFGAVGSSAQNGFTNFVELGDWEFDIGNKNVKEYCYLDGNLGTDTDECGIYTTGDDFTDGDLYLGATGQSEIKEGFLRLYSENGFDAGTIVQDGDADEGSEAFDDSGVTIGIVETVAGDNKLQNAELGAIFVYNTTGTKVAKDDLLLSTGTRVDEDHDMFGASIDKQTWQIVYADIDGSGDYDADEPLFANIDEDSDEKVTDGDLIMSGEFILTLVDTSSSYLANPTLLNITDEADGDYTNHNYSIVILDEQDDYEENDYRGEDLVLARMDDTLANRVGEDSFVLTGDRAGELIDEDHPYHEEDMARIDDNTDTATEHFIICGEVEDAADFPVTHQSHVIFHFGDTTCSSGDPDEGDVDANENTVLLSDRDGELASFAHQDAIDNDTFFVIDLNNDGDMDDGEPILYDADNNGKISTLDVVFTAEGAVLVGPGYKFLAPTAEILVADDDDASGRLDLEFCTYHEEEEDDNGDDIWVPMAVHLRTYWVAEDEANSCDTEDVVANEFVLAGTRNVGSFLTEDQADMYEGEYALEKDGKQPDYFTLYDDLFPSGFGPEDVIFLVPTTSPVLDEKSFYLGGPAVVDGDDYFEVDVDDLDELGVGKTGNPYLFIEGDNREGLSQADWFYLASNSDPSIDDESLILYKGAVAVTTPEEGEETPEEGEETPEEGGEGEEGGEEGEEPKKQPGFEVLALLAALGAALVLVRRRN